jgi:hypothetical protein
VHTADICVMCPLYCRNGVDTRNKPERFETCAEKWRGWCTTALFPAVHSARCASCTLRTRATQPGIEGSRLDSCARLPRAVLMVIGVDVALITLLYCHSLLQRTAHTSQHNVEDQVSVLNAAVHPQQECGDMIEVCPFHTAQTPQVDHSTMLLRAYRYAAAEACMSWLACHVDHLQIYQIDLR